MINEKKLKNKYGKVWLNVASNIYVLEDFINLDNHIFLKYLNLFKIISPFFNKDKQKMILSFNEANKRTKMLVHDCRKKLKFKDNSVDHILCSHFLEHVFSDEMKNILIDFHRALKSGGTLHVIVPDISHFINKYIYESKEKKLSDSAADRLIDGILLSNINRPSIRFQVLELLGGFGLNHRWMYDYKSMKKYIEKTGFKITDESEIPSSYVRKNEEYSVHVFAKK